MMLKTIFIVFLCSLLAIMGLKQCIYIVHLLWESFAYLNNQLITIFSGSTLARWLRQALALTTVTALPALIFATGYRLLFKKSFPCLMSLVWVLWVATLVTVSLHIHYRLV